jgi:hypothetical protein
MSLRKIIAVGVAVLGLGAVVPMIASAETLMMPDRDARTTTPVVVWGVTTQVQSAALSCVMDFGDGSAIQACNNVDRSYIAYAHTYANQGTYTATLTVGAESASTTIRVFNPAAFADGGAAGDSNRSLGINMAIQDGLRFLWTAQINRAANFPAGTTTFWQNTGYPYADTSLAVLAFENQGYKITANVAPTGLYEKYIVRRGLNYVLTNLATVALGVTPAGNNPCLVVGDCTGLRPPGDEGYTTALAILSLAGSGALPHVNTEVGNCGGASPGFLCNKTYGNILQRLVNTLAWGQNDTGTGRGGWYYTFNSTVADGSTAGWDILAFLDAGAAGATVPPWVVTEFALSLTSALNNDGSFDYQADANAASNNNVGPQKNGIGLQGLFLIGETTGARVTSVTNNVNSWWSGIGGLGGNVWGQCGPIAGAANKGCAYTMFNNFKGLKLQNIVTLPGVTRPAGPGAQPAGDWYADYQDWLVANQQAPQTTTNGSWSTMGFSCCASGSSLTTAIAELILAPVALVAPDPGLFSSVGLSPPTATNPVGTDHTVTAFAQAANGNPVPGVTINFSVLTGPNAGKTGSGTTGADGKVSFTYHDDGGAGTDTIQAFIGTTLASNQVTKTWANAGLTCDIDADQDVDTADLALIRAAIGQPAAGNPRDAKADGKITINDVRYCTLRCTRASCATQ